MCLERACPLMELLPTTIDDTYKLDAFAFANAYFEADVDSNGQAKTPLEDGEDFQGNYAANCFALLRSVYMRIYDKQQQQQQQQQLDTQRVVPPSIQRNKPSSIRPVKMATIKTRNPPVRFLAAEDEEYEDYYDEYMALLDKIHGDGEEAESRVGKIVTQAENERCESGAGKQEDSTAAIEDLIEQLRQPFQHLRSEILLVRNQDTSSSVGSKQRKDEKKTMKERYLQETEGRFEDDSHADSPSSQSKKTKKRMREEWEQSTKIQYESNLFKDEDFLLPSYLEREDLERELGLRRDQTMTASDTDDTDPFGLGSTGSSTSIVSSDLEIMLRKFVKEDSQGRKKILKQASHYYSDLHTNFPYVSDDNEIIYCMCIN
ncbi:hypothetical protein EON65_28870 [archaeon]|nr:MAG: hypothetical protein EON65_28870 [archaeon]